MKQYGLKIGVLRRKCVNLKGKYCHVLKCLFLSNVCRTKSTNKVRRLVTDWDIISVHNCQKISSDEKKSSSIDE